MGRGHLAACATLPVGSHMHERSMQKHPTCATAFAISCESGQEMRLGFSRTHGGASHAEESSKYMERMIVRSLQYIKRTQCKRRARTRGQHNQDRKKRWHESHAITPAAASRGRQGRASRQLKRHLPHADRIQDRLYGVVNNTLLTVLLACCFTVKLNSGWCSRKPHVGAKFMLLFEQRF